MRWRVLGAALAVGLAGLTGCTGSDPPSSPTGGAAPTTLATYATRGVAVVRGPFCDRVSPTGVEHVLGGPPQRSSSWVNGDRVRLPDGSRDRVHEYGCAWAAEDGTRVRAWVFAPPVSPARARVLSRDAAGPRCSVRRTDDFGRVSVVTSCSDGSARERAYHGLFGDAWVSCALASTSDTDLTERAGQWCVTVLEAARA